MLPKHHQKLRAVKSSTGGYDTVAFRPHSWVCPDPSSPWFSLPPLCGDPDLLAVSPQYSSPASQICHIYNQSCCLFGNQLSFLTSLLQLILRVLWMLQEWGNPARCLHFVPPPCPSACHWHASGVEPCPAPVSTPAAYQHCAPSSLLSPFFFSHTHTHYLAEALIWVAACQKQWLYRVAGFPSYWCQAVASHSRPLSFLLLWPGRTGFFFIEA